jgi:signal transduction histidine kinase
VFGLKNRVILAFGVLSLAVALAVSGTAYVFARSYLVAQRENAGITRALLDARAVSTAVQGGSDPGDAIADVPVVGGVQALARVSGTWYTRGAGASPDDVPASLLEEAARSGAANQRFLVGDGPVYGVAVASGDDVYLELAPLGDLDRALRTGGWFVVVISLLALAFGALLGAWAAKRLLRPVGAMSSGAVRIAEGDLGVRLPPTSDPDLEPLSTAFNDMADAVEQRIARERRFVANVSHELRSPVTAVLGTAELLDNHRAELPARDAELASSLVDRARRLSKTLVDLLEIGGRTGSHPLQLEAVDVASIAAALLHERGLATDVLRGDRPVVRSDARLVERVLANLLDNAATHGGGVRQVVVERVADAVLVHVDDEGPGVMLDHVDELFEPFARGSSADGHAGAGLGLAIAREAAEAVDASIGFDVSPFGGARATLRLPADGPL